MEAIAGAVAALLGIVLILLRRHFATMDSTSSDVSQAERELRQALAAKQFDDAAFWARRLATLRGQQ